jgi:flagellar motor switch protein FliN/FliY
MNDENISSEPNPAQAELPESGTNPQRAAAPDAAVATNLSLLLDAELGATIRFGNRELLLREILGLTPGDVVELDQHVDEPAQLIVAGRAIARGEVVVVDGNFGLRITEVASASQRAEVIRGW